MLLIPLPPAVSNYRSCTDGENEPLDFMGAFGLRRALGGHPGGPMGDHRAGEGVALRPPALPETEKLEQVRQSPWPGKGWLPALPAHLRPG